MRHSLKLSIKEKNYEGNKNLTFDSFEEIPTENLENILKTKNFSFINWENNHRKGENFQSAYGFVVDIDNGQTINEALSVLERYRLNYALITSKSHSEEKHKFHILLPFSRPASADEYKTITAAISDKLFPNTDKATLDLGRFIFGSPENAVYKCNFERNDLNVEELLTKYALAPQTQPSRKTPSSMDKWDENTELIKNTSEIVFAKDITKKTPIKCPFHDDNNASAFVEYSKKSQNHFIHCSTCGKTFWKKKTEIKIDEITQNFWSTGQGIYEAGLVDDTFSLENIGEKKFYSKIGAVSQDEKKHYFDYLVQEKHLHRLNRINNIGAVDVEESKFEVDIKTGNITVSVKAINTDISDNKYIEDYLEKTFGNHKQFIKEWLAAYAYTNYKKLPTLIFIGARGVGKNTFAESVMQIFLPLSEIAKDLEGNFNQFAEKKLLVIDESASNGKMQYQALKKYSGQAYITVNKKYIPEYQVQNNINIILLSNDDMPIYVQRDEMPTDTRNNQFFVFRMTRTEDLNPNLKNEIIKRLGHYVRTELKTVFEQIDMSKYRYTIDVPITEEERRLFNNSITEVEYEADRIIEKIQSDPTHPFILKGHLPTDYFETINPRVNKQKVIQNLQQRGILTNEKAGKHIQLKGARPYSYKLDSEFCKSLPTKSACSIY